MRAVYVGEWTLQPRRNSATPRESASKFAELARCWKRAEWNAERVYLFIYLSNGFRWNCFKKNNVLFVYFWKDFIIKIARVGKNLSRDGYVYIKWGEINPWKLRYGKKSTCIELFSCARWLRETIENRVKSWQAIREAIQYSVEKVNKYFVHTVQLYIYFFLSIYRV